MSDAKPNATLYMPMAVDTFARISKAMPKGAVVRPDPADSSILHVYFVEGEVYDDDDECDCCECDD